MYIEIDKFTNRYDEKALFSLLNLSSLFFFVLLSYYQTISCYQRIKTLLDCLNTMSYCRGSTHRAMAESSEVLEFNQRRNV
jgi:hypothetical protein